MSSVRKVALSTTTIAAAAFFSVAHAAATTPAPFNEEIVRLGHGFELGSGEGLVLAHHRKPVTYRVCVKDVPGVAPLKVNVDGKKIEVMDGTCADVVGAHITVMPSDKLSQDRTMVGRFERVKQ
jgi:hypothetical protein